MISKFLKILGLQPWISLEQFFLTVGQNNFGNKIPLSPKNEVMNAWPRNKIMSSRTQNSSHVGNTKMLGSSLTSYLEIIRVKFDAKSKMYDKKSRRLLHVHYGPTVKLQGKTPWRVPDRWVFTTSLGAFHPLKFKSLVCLSKGFP